MTIPRRRPLLAPALFLALGALAPSSAPAQWTGTGDAALVVAESVSVYKDEAGPATIHLLVKDEIVAAHGTGRRFRDPNGRARVELLVQDGRRARVVSGWLPLGPELLRFTFPCGCQQGCWPFEEAGRDVRWNRCVQEAAMVAATSGAAP